MMITQLLNKLIFMLLNLYIITVTVNLISSKENNCKRFIGPLNIYLYIQLGIDINNIHMHALCMLQRSI